MIEAYPCQHCVVEAEVLDFVVWALLLQCSLKEIKLHLCGLLSNHLSFEA